jgi:predicted amidohydrolase YtcJ
MIKAFRNPKMILASSILLWGNGALAAEQVADTIYLNGYIYTVDASNSIAQAVAVREGKILYVGSDDNVGSLAGADTRIVNLQGRMMMPGLVDGHMHPLSGGLKLMGCSLNYEALTVQQFRARIQACLDNSRDKEPGDWLVVQSWFQTNMLPPGTNLTFADLDALDTTRPIIVRSSFGHTTLANSRAMELARITENTADPENGIIARDARGRPTGLFEDSAQDLFSALLPQSGHAELLAAGEASLQAMNAQGITSMLDASAERSDVAIYAELQREGKLTVRAHFAVLVEPEDARKPDEAVASVLAIAHEFDQGPIVAEPTITVRNAKLFMDGVITAPNFTGVMLDPYLRNQGTEDKPDWVSSGNRGPAPYFAADEFRTLLLKLAAAGIDPHVHADGDGATRYTLDGFQAMRERFPGEKIRASIAHVEIVNPADFPRFAELDVIPVASFQWGKPASDTIEGARDYLGPERFKYIEPQGFLHQAGARIAYGSDWPVDLLDEWFGLKVGVTRTNAPEAAPHYTGRLSEDPGLSRDTAVRAITMNSSYEIHQESETGSLEVGKLADLIVLDRNLFEIPAEEIADIQVLMTVVGGKVVYQSDRFDSQKGM